MKVVLEDSVLCQVPYGLQLTLRLLCYCLVGGCHVTQLVVKNEGGPGRFCIMPSAVWPTTNFKVIVLLSGWRLSCDTAGSEE